MLKFVDPYPLLAHNKMPLFFVCQYWSSYERTVKELKWRILIFFIVLFEYFVLTIYYFFYNVQQYIFELLHVV